MNSRYRMHQIKLNMNETKSDIPKKILKRLNNRDLILTDLKIIKESLDARDKKDIKLVYTVDFQAVTRQRPKQYASLPLNPKLGLEEAPDMSYIDVESGGEEMIDQPVIVGFGPCGMFAGLILAKRGYRPIIIERGSQIEKRVKDVECFLE